MDGSGQAALRWGLLIAVFCVVALAEMIRPRRALLLIRGRRWTTHGLIFLTNTIVGRLLAFVVAIPLAAQWSAEAGFGLFQQIDLPIWIQAIVAFILLDLAVWLQHLAMHKLPWLWRMHRVHHADRDLDVTTALRFHPFELIVSTLYKSAWVAALGAPIAVVLAFELWLNANALFNHGNLRLPKWLDRAARLFLVTPDMHLVHHSTRIEEQHSNYGFALTLWDRLSGCYAVESLDGRDKQQIGLAEINDERSAQLGWTLKFPLT
jgi:sterol desaturase/sphingolipid hydroxylase (fatty acid hydroxylase superfamily)